MSATIVLHTYTRELLRSRHPLPECENASSSERELNKFPSLSTLLVEYSHKYPDLVLRYLTETAFAFFGAKISHLLKRICRMRGYFIFIAIHKAPCKERIKDSVPECKTTACFCCPPTGSFLMES
jgi:hypothetical protein